MAVRIVDWSRGRRGGGVSSEQGSAGVLLEAWANGGRWADTRRCVLERKLAGLDGRWGRRKRGNPKSCKHKQAHFSYNNLVVAGNTVWHSFLKFFTWNKRFFTMVFVQPGGD